jgi:hypothetical protein
MRRLVLSSSLLAAVLLAAAAPATPTRGRDASARFVLQISAVTAKGTIVLQGSGAVDNTRALATADFASNTGASFAAVIASSPHLTIFLHGGVVQDLPEGKTWERADGAAAAPLIDPGLPLRLGSHGGRKIGTARVGGVPTTEYAIEVGLPDAALLAPAASRQVVGRGLPATVWLDGSGHVRHFHATVPFGKGTAVVDESLSDFGTPVQVALPPAASVWDSRLDAVEVDIRSAIAAIESYRADNDSGGKYDPDKSASGYEGMTAAYLRSNYDLDINPHLKVVRATKTTYCVEETRNGVTAKKDGPSAPIMQGRC